MAQTFSENQSLIEDETRTIFRGKIKLNPQISTINYLCSLCHYFVMTFIFVSVESMQPLLFQQKFGIHPKDSGTENGYILLIDIGTKCIFAPIMGILSDKYGRVPILQIGMVITASSLIFMGFSENLYPQYCLARILYAVGAITLATIPFLADYVHDDTKGRASALNVVLAALGAVFSATVITKLLTESLSIQMAYLVIGITFLVLGISYTIGLKKGLHFKDQKRPSSTKNESLCPYQNHPIVRELYNEDDDYIDYDKEVETLQAIKDEMSWMSAIKIAVLAGSNIWIFQGYVTNFLGRGDSILLTLSLQIWSQQFVDPSLNDDDAYKQASIKAQTLSGVTYTVIMVFALFYGIMFEKISKNILLMSIFGLTMVGCFMMNFAPDPTSAYTFVTMGILGIGMSGLYTAALYLVNKYAYIQFRGYISGLANVFSVLGILICSFIGGLLQDRWSKIAPFNLFGIMSLVGMILVMWSYFKLYNKKQKK